MTSTSFGVTDPSDIGRSAIAKVNSRLIPLVLVLYVIAMIDRTNVGFAALQMNDDLGFSSTVYGLGAAIFFIGYGLFEVPSNLILAKVGARRWIARILFTWGLLATGMMFVVGEYSFYVMRFLLGVAEAGFLPGILYYLSHWYPAAYRAQAVAWFMIGIPLAQVVGSPLAGALLGLDGVYGLQGWQWMYLIEGLPAVAMAFVVVWLMPDSPTHATWLRPEESAWLQARVASEHNEAERRHGLGITDALLHPTVWWLALISFAIQTGSYGLQLWTPLIVKEWSGLSNLAVGFVSAIPYLGAALGMVLIGRSSDRSGERFMHITAPTAMSALGFATAAMLASPTWGIVALTVAAIGNMGSRGPFWSLPSRFLAGSAAAGGIALINAMGAFGGFVGPLAIGKIKDVTGDYTYGLLFLALLLVLATAMTLRLRDRAELQTEHSSALHPG